MIVQWTQHLSTDEDKDRFSKSIMAAKPVLDRLQQLLDKEYLSLETAEISPKIYDTPNWDYKQAHTNGFKAALKMVGKIINLDPKE